MSDSNPPSTPPGKPGFFARGLQWPLLVVVILSSSVLAHIIVIAKISNDPTFAVQENYYEDAVNWDARKRLERDSEALGWEVDASAKAVKIPDDGTKLRLDLALRDATGEAIQDADVWVKAFAVARSRRIVSGAMSSGTGGYRTELDGGRPGLWQLDLDIRRGDQRFVHTMRVDAAVLQ